MDRADTSKFIKEFNDFVAERGFTVDEAYYNDFSGMLCKLSITVDSNKILYYTGVQPTKIEAKVEAIEEALKDPRLIMQSQLQPQPQSQPQLQSHVIDRSSSVMDLHEYCQKNNCSFSETYAAHGPPHMPEYRCDLIFTPKDGNIKKYVGFGTTKKLAKNEAAYSAMKEVESGRIARVGFPVKFYTKSAIKPLEFIPKDIVDCEIKIRISHNFGTTQFTGVGATVQEATDCAMKMINNFRNLNDYGKMIYLDCMNCGISFKIQDQFIIITDQSEELTINTENHIDNNYIKFKKIMETKQ